MAEQIKKSEPRDFIKAIAMDIGKEVAHHIKIMYPEAVTACSSTFLLSVRNTTYNRIMSALNPGNTNEVASTLKRNALFRKEISSAYRKIRKRKQSGTP